METLSFQEFSRLEEAWNELVMDSESPVPFMSHQWLRTWWRHFGDGLEFVAPVVRDGGTLVAAAPLVLRRVRVPGLSMTVGEIVGTGPVPTRGMGLADKADFPVRRDAPEARARVLHRLRKELARIDVLDVKGLDETSPTVRELVAATGPGAARTIARSTSPYLPLSIPWEEYLRSRSGNFRKHLKKYWRLLGQAGPVETVRMQPGDDCEKWMAEIFAVNDVSWKAERGTNLFRSRSLRAFFTDVVREMSDAGWIDLHVMRLAGQAAAYELCFDFAGRLFSYNGSYRKELRRSSPGTALTAVVIQAACERGRVEYDMLRGEEEYKLRWSRKFRSEMQVLVPAPRLRARAGTYLLLYLKAKLKQSKRLEEWNDRLSGALNRLRHRP